MRAHEARRLPGFFALVGVLLATLGCLANRPALTCPNKGGPPWVEVRTPHFFVQTDLPESRAEQIAIEVETMRAALLAAMGAPPDDLATPVEVVVFELAQDFHTISGVPRVDGLFSQRLRGDMEAQPVIQMHGRLSRYTRSVLQHELTHQILRRRTAQLPWWMDEGLSELYSTLRIESEGVAVVGEPPFHVDFWSLEYRGRAAGPVASWVSLPASWAPDLEGILAVDRLSLGTDTRRVELYYAASWKFVHALRGHRNPSYSPRFAAMMRDLTSGVPGQVAFARAYKGVPMSEIEGAYREMLLDDREYPQTIHFEVPAGKVSAPRTMSDAEVHALWARLATANDETRAGVEEQLARGLEENPGALPLLYAKASIYLRWDLLADVRQDVQLLRAADSGDPRYMLLDLIVTMGKLERMKHEEAEAAETGRVLALADRISSAARSPMQRAGAAVVLLAIDRDRALALSQEAAEQDPSCGMCFEVLALALVGSGRLQEAKVAVERAIALLPDGALPEGTRRLLAQIEKELVIPHP